MILFYLGSLPRLFSLTIQLEEEHYYNAGDIYRIIFHLPSLRFSKISLPYDEEYNIFVPVTINEKYSTIEHLVLNHSCTINKLSSILSHTPQLRRLNCQDLIENDDITIRDVLLALPNLTHIHFVECNVEFDALETFIHKISARLQVFQLNTFWRNEYLDPNRWKQLIKKHMPHLSRFHFNHRTYPDEDDDDIVPNYESINQFTSPFWTKRQWFFELKDDFFEYVYSISPYR